MTDKRSDYISWDEYFMGVAKLSGMRSKDPNSQVGPVLSARITRFCLWAITGSQRDAQTMCFHGPGKETSWIPNISM